MDAFTRCCPICLALVRMWDLEAHQDWHKTLTNLPRT